MQISDALGKLIFRNTTTCRSYRVVLFWSVTLFPEGLGELRLLLQPAFWIIGVCAVVSTFEQRRLHCLEGR